MCADETGPGGRRGPHPQGCGQRRGQAVGSPHRQGGNPAYLMLLDGLIEAYPQNGELLVAACQAYASYAGSFLEDEGGERASLLYRRARQYGFRALSRNGDFSKAASGSLDDLSVALAQLTKKDVPASSGPPMPGRAGSAETSAAWRPWLICPLWKPPSRGPWSSTGLTIPAVPPSDGSSSCGQAAAIGGICLEQNGTLIARSRWGGKDAWGQGFVCPVLCAGCQGPGALPEHSQGSPRRTVDDPPEMTFGNVMAKEKAGVCLRKRRNTLVNRSSRESIGSRVPGQDGRHAEHCRLSWSLFSGGKKREKEKGWRPSPSRWGF